MVQKSSQNDTKIEPKSLQKSIKKRSPKNERKNSKNEPKMEPKGLPKFPGKSRKSPPRRPRTTQVPAGIRKGPPRHPTAAKRTSKDLKKWPQGPPNELQGLPKGPPKAHQRTPKDPKGSPNEPKSTQQHQQQPFFLNFLEKSSFHCAWPGGMRGAFESAAPLWGSRA